MRRALAIVSTVSLVLAVGAVLPWSDAVLGSVILFAVAGTTTSIVWWALVRGRRLLAALRYLNQVADDLDLTEAPDLKVVQ